MSSEHPGGFPGERTARLVGGPADGHLQTVVADAEGVWPLLIRSDSGVGEEPGAVYRLTPAPTAEGDLVYELDSEQGPVDPR
jgi:hypothetical protein